MTFSIKRYRSTVHVVVALCLVWAAAAKAQPAAQDSWQLGSRFASSTITEHDADLRFPGMFFDTADNLIVQGTPLVALIGEAYGMKEFQIVDGPEWIHAPTLYDIKAVPPPSELIQSDRVAMLRSLLSDRFKLQLLETSRDMKVLALEFVEETPALQLTASPRLKIPPGRKEGILFSRRPGAAVAEPPYVLAELTLATVAAFLARELDRHVVDMTGLEGIWTLELEGVDSRRRGLEFAPLLEQLGLRLVERTLAIDVVSIKSIERPTLDD